jgi:hypothetical protein
MVVHRQSSRDPPETCLKRAAKPEQWRVPSNTMPGSTETTISRPSHPMKEQRSCRSSANVPSICGYMNHVVSNPILTANMAPTVAQATILSPAAFAMSPISVRSLVMSTAHVGKMCQHQPAEEIAHEFLVSRIRNF